MSNLNAIKNAKDFDELEKAGQETYAGGTEGLTWEQIDAAYNARAAELRAQGILPWWEQSAAPAEPLRPAAPMLTVVQRNHWLLLDVEPRGYPFNVIAKTEGGPWRANDMRAAFGSENVMPIPVKWSRFQIQARWADSEDWGTVITVKNAERPRRVSRSNPYWHYWSINDREGFSRVCRDCVPGVNERDEWGIPSAT